MHDPKHSRTEQRAKQPTEPQESASAETHDDDGVEAEELCAEGLEVLGGQDDDAGRAAEQGRGERGAEVVAAADLAQAEEVVPV